jgi:hypothetical protein
MPGLVRGIHAPQQFHPRKGLLRQRRVDARDKPGHDVQWLYQRIAAATAAPLVAKIANNFGASNATDVNKSA